MKLKQDVTPTYRTKTAKRGKWIYGGTIKEFFTENLGMKALIAVCGMFAGIFGAIAGLVFAFGKGMEYLKKQVDQNASKFKIFFVIVAALNMVANAIKEKQEDDE